MEVVVRSVVEGEVVVAGSVKTELDFLVVLETNDVDRKVFWVDN